MKTLKLIFFLSFILLFFSCKNNSNLECAFFHSHSIYLSFRDVSGNDLVKGIGYNDDVPIENAGIAVVKPDLYTLKIIFPEDAVDTNDTSLWTADILDDVVYRPFLCLTLPNYLEDSVEHGEEITKAFGGYCHLFFCTQSRRQDNVEKLIYRVACPYIFGDDMTHDIVTYWRKNDKTRPEDSKACYRIELDGKEFTDLSYANFDQTVSAKIVLDR